MLQTFMYGPGDVRVEEVPEPSIIKPTDAIIKMVRTCICGSDLWPYRGLDGDAESGQWPRTMGHEYIGEVVEVGSAVRSIKVGQFVVGSFATSDGTCEICRSGYYSHCLDREFADSAQAQYFRVHQADGTLVATDGTPDDDLLPSLLAASDVLGTGYYAAKAAEVAPGKTVVVVGDGAVGLMGVLSARMLGAERIIAMSRHEDRAALAREFGATDVVAERDAEGIAHVLDLTAGLGAHSVLEAVGSQQSMEQAIGACRPGGHVGFVGVSHDQTLNGTNLFFSGVHLHGGPAPVRAWLPELIEAVQLREINPGRVFDMHLPLSRAAEGYAAMDERRAIKVLLDPWVED